MESLSIYHYHWFANFCCKINVPLTKVKGQKAKVVKITLIFVQMLEFIVKSIDLTDFHWELMWPLLRSKTIQRPAWKIKEFSSKILCEINFRDMFHKNLQLLATLLDVNLQIGHFLTCDVFKNVKNTIFELMKLSKFISRKIWVAKYSKRVREKKNSFKITSPSKKVVKSNAISFHVKSMFDFRILIFWQFCGLLILLYVSHENLHKLEKEPLKLSKW